eukprot:s5107_g1.t1
MPPAARRMLATKSKPKPRFSEEDRKKACERLKRLEQEAHDAKLAAELQRKQFDKDFGDNSDDDDRRPNPSASGSGIPRDSQGRAIEPDRRGRSRSRHERPAPEKPPKRGRHKEPEKPERPVTPPRGPKHKKEGDKGRGKDKGSKGKWTWVKAKAGYWEWLKSIGYFWVPGKAKGKGTERKKGKEKGKPKSKTWHGSQAERTRWVEKGRRGRDPPEEYHHEGDDEEGDAPPHPDMGYRGRGGYDDDDDDGGDDDDDDGGEGWRLKLWEKRVLAWMPAGEAAMLLLESLTGIAELETEHLALEKVNCETGIQTIPDALRAPLSERSLYLKRLYLQEWETVALRAPLSERSLYLKRLYLQEWETVGRQQGESVRNFVNRYRRVVQDLQSMQIGLEAAFSSEALTYRLLERCKLSPDQQRIVLVGSQQSFEYELVRESLLLQREEHRPAQGGGPVKATGITRLPCATDGKHYLIDSCELTAGIPMLGSLKLLKALGTVLDLPAETAYLSKLQV